MQRTNFPLTTFNQRAYATEHRQMMATRSLTTNFVFMVSRDGCGDMGLSAVCDCGISSSYSITIFVCMYLGQKYFYKLIYVNKISDLGLGRKEVLKMTSVIFKSFFLFSRTNSRTSKVNQQSVFNL